MKKIQIELEEKELQMVVDQLSKMPYYKSYKVVQKIMSQYSEQSIVNNDVQQ